MKKIAIITGASSGIGLETAKLFLQKGWDIINISRTPCTIELDANKSNILRNYQCDLADFDRLKEVCAEVNKQLEGYQLASLIHNSAIYRYDNYENLNEDEYLAVLKVNLIAPQLINKILLPKLAKMSLDLQNKHKDAEYGCSCIFIGSTLSEVGTSNLLSYISSKHALAGMMKSVSQDLKGKNTHTALICPGFTDTKMLRDNIKNNESIMAQISQKTAFNRIVKPQEIARSIYFTSKNPAINGSVIHANLGFLD